MTTVAATLALAAPTAAGAADLGPGTQPLAAGVDGAGRHDRLVAHP